MPSLLAALAVEEVAVKVVEVVVEAEDRPPDVLNTECYADVFKDGTGVVEFLRYEDMKYAVKKLDDSRFRSHEVSHSSRFVPKVLCLKAIPL